jgi:hypothetical protein
MKYEDVIGVYNEMKRLLESETESRVLYRLHNIVTFLIDHFNEIDSNNPEYIRGFFDENEIYYKMYPSLFDDSGKPASDYAMCYGKLFNLCISNPHD